MEGKVLHMIPTPKKDEIVTQFPVVLKPLLRGWLHAIAEVVAVIVTVLLCLRSRHDLPRLLSLLVYGLSMIELYTVSAIYHIGTWPERPRRLLRAIDHAN